MIQPDVKESMSQRHRRFRWEAFLPKRKAWMQTLILLPFGGSVANFLVISWHFSATAIFAESQYLIGIAAIAINALLPSLFFSFLCHWIWFVRKQTSPTWYPQTKGLGAGCYATLTIAVSFGTIGLFTNSLGVCGNPAWGAVSQTLLCNLDGYGFESKSWFGGWCIIAAYCYQVLNSILAWRNSCSNPGYRQQYSPQFSDDESQSANYPDPTSISIDPVTINPED
jgi:hypothetical protein